MPARRAAVREIEEELGLKISEDSLKLFTVVAIRTNHENINHEFFVELEDNEKPTNNESDKCSERV